MAIEMAEKVKTRRMRKPLIGNCESSKQSRAVVLNHFMLDVTTKNGRVCIHARHSP